MVHQQELHDTLPSLLCDRCVCLNLHPWEGGHGAGCNGLGGLLDLDEAHAAVPGNGEAAVVAEARDINASDLAGLEHREPLGDPHGVPVDKHLERVLRVARQLDARPAHGLPRRRQRQTLG